MTVRVSVRESRRTPSRRLAVEEYAIGPGTHSKTVAYESVANRHSTDVAKGVPASEQTRELSLNRSCLKRPSRRTGQGR